MSSKPESSDSDQSEVQDVQNKILESGHRSESEAGILPLSGHDMVDDNCKDNAEVIKGNNNIPTAVNKDEPLNMISDVSKSDGSSNVVVVATNDNVGIDSAKTIKRSKEDDQKDLSEESTVVCTELVAEIVAEAGTRSDFLAAIKMLRAGLDDSAGRIFVDLARESFPECKGQVYSPVNEGVSDTENVRVSSPAVSEDSLSGVSLRIKPLSSLIAGSTTAEIILSEGEIIDDDTPSVPDHEFPSAPSHQGPNTSEVTPDAPALLVNLGAPGIQQYALPLLEGLVTPQPPAWVEDVKTPSKGGVDVSVAVSPPRQVMALCILDEDDKKSIKGRSTIMDKVYIDEPCGSKISAGVLLALFERVCHVTHFNK